MRELLGDEPQLRDFVRGNIKARERMVIQYSIAGQLNLLVVGTDHAAEAVTGFFTKYGDGGVDITPLTGLTKRQGAALLQELGAPPSVWEKVPTADLEDDRPALPDEVALGLTYTQIDDYLEGTRRPAGPGGKGGVDLPRDPAQAGRSGHPTRRLVAGLILPSTRARPGTVWSGSAPG